MRAEAVKLCHRVHDEAVVRVVEWEGERDRTAHHHHSRVHTAARRQEGTSPFPRGSNVAVLRWGEEG